MKRFLISNIFICLIIIPNVSYSKAIDVGLLISSWGSGIEGDYIFKDDINFGGNYHSTTMDIDSSGTSVKVKVNHSNDPNVRAQLLSCCVPQKSQI